MLSSLLVELWNLLALSFHGKRRASNLSASCCSSLISANENSIFPPANSIEPALTASQYFSGKTARPKVIDLETHTISSYSAPVPAAPVAEARGSEPPEPNHETRREEPTKSKSAPTPFITPAATMLIIPEAEKVVEPEPEPVQEAKSLEIQQPESEDDEPAREQESIPDAPRAQETAPPASAITATATNGDSVTAPKDQLLVKKLSDKATLPTRGSPLSAGYDLYAAEDKVVPARGKALVDLQLSIAVPEGTYGRVAPRSGLASKYSIDTGAGVIDADYRGPVMVLLYNLSDNDFTGEFICLSKRPYWYPAQSPPSIHPPPSPPHLPSSFRHPQAIALFYFLPSSSFLMALSIRR